MEFFRLPWSKIALTIIIALILVGAGPFVLTSRNNQRSLSLITPTPQVKISLSPTSLSNPGQTTAIVNWKTYTNSTYRYSIQYPPSQSIIDMAGNTKSTMYSVEIGVPDAPGDNYPSVYIDVIPQNGALPGTYNNDEFMQNLKQYIISTSVGKVIRPKNEPFNIQFIRRDSMNINGNTAYVFESMSFHEKRVVIQRSGILYVIGGYNPDAQFNQILSTFKFTTL